MITKEQEAQQKVILTVAHADYGKGLGSYAFFKVSNREDSQDLVQNTFIKTWNYIVKGGKIETMRAFLYNVLNNLIVDEYRKRNHKTSSLDILVENGFESASNIEDPAQLVDIIDGKSVMALIHHLPPPYDGIIHMRFVKDLTLKEISVVTGRTKNSIAVLVHRGLIKLRALYEHE